MRTNVVGLISALVVTGAVASFGATNGFTVPAFRGQPDSTFTGWESFTVAVGQPGNAGDMTDSSTAAKLLQLEPGALVLGSGNLYNGSGASQFEIRYSGEDPVAAVILQIRTLGTELRYDDVALTAWADNLPGTRTELNREGFGGPPGTPGSGFAVSTEWAWDLTGLEASNFAVSFDAVELNLSLDSVTLDVQMVPEPSPVALGLLGALALLAVRRRS